MVLRDSFIASEKVKIVMLTCICPGMSSANHTLNSLRYAERLKEKGPGSTKIAKHGLSNEQIAEELKMFMEKHGVEANETGPNQDINFYDNDRIEELDDDQDLLLDDNDMMNDNEMEDDIAQVSKYSKKSPNAMVNSTRKGANLANISNTVQNQRNVGNNS